MIVRLVISLVMGALVSAGTCFLPLEEQGTGSARVRPIPVERFGTGSALPLMILLHGVNGPSAFYRDQAAFFAVHGYRVLLPHYLEAGHGVKATDQNYEAWIEAVRAAMDASQAQAAAPTVIVGYSLGASVALALGSQGQGPKAIAEFYGSLPDRYYRDLKAMPPLLILHGNQDTNIPVSNALQLAQLCSQSNLNCDMHLYSKEGHGFTPEALQDADQRVLTFMSKVLGTVPENEPRSTHR